MPETVKDRVRPDALNKPSIASQLKKMTKEELEVVIANEEIDATTRSFARVFLRKVASKVKPIEQ